MNSKLALIFLLVLSIPSIAADKTLAVVDHQFSYGFDVTWVHLKKNLKPGTALSIEWPGGRYVTTLVDLKVGFSGKVGIIYVSFTPPDLPVPSGATIRIMK